MQLGERAPAAIRMMADAIAGGDTKKLFEMMEKGEIDPNTALPALAAQMGMRADQGWESRLQTIGHQQDTTIKRWEDFIKLFSESGGGDGFWKIWNALAETLPKLDNIAKALGSAFSLLGEGVQRTGNIMVMLNDAVGWFNNQTPVFQNSLGTLGAAFLLLGTRIGRAFLPLTAAFLVLEDIATYHQGGKSITGLAMGEDYNSKAPASITAPNDYSGKPLGGVVESLRRRSVNNPGFLNTAALEFTKAGSKWYQGLGYLISNPSSIIDTLSQSLPMNWGEAETMSSENMNSLINNLSGSQNLLYGNSTAPSLNIENVTINAETNDPKLMADEFIKAIDLKAASANFPVGEGGG